MPSDNDTPVRSKSPSRDDKKTKPSGQGFKWKEKRARDEDSSNRNEGRLERGYRDRSPRRDSYRDRSPRRNRSPRQDNHRRSDRYGSSNNNHRYTERSPPRRPNDDAAAGDTHRPNRASPPPADDSLAFKKPSEKKEKKEKKKDKKDKPSSTSKSNSSEPMIIVNVNDRLGTKAAIPCLASDSVKAFKAMVAAHIGRQPHEIMLKRQGERPFKDILSLADYGVSNGVQLDLELDTGD